MKEFDNMLKEKLSPIPRDDNNAECRSVDSEFNESVDLLGNENKFAMTKDTVQCDSAHSSNDVAIGKVHLNIKDIGNDTSDDSVLNNAQLVTNTTNTQLVVKSVGDDNDCDQKEKFGNRLDVSAETGDLNDSIDYKSVDEEIAKSNTQLKTEISAADTPEKDNSSSEDESTITASKITDTDDEKNVIITASMSTDGSTLVEKTEFPLLQFFPDSDDISTDNYPSTSGEKNAREGISDKTKDEVSHDENAEITDNSATDGKGEKNEEITDNTMTDGKGKKKEEITDNCKTESAAVSKAVISGKSKQTKLHMENQNENSEDGNENDKTDA